ncbi:site-specific integrase [Klebsiella michiganensis]|uniref:site-specific integrase n=1 Tax=Klebsiella TaxID=570 RepID=UPI0007DABD02|nr:site-specific integrase [Klebsiella michiganensis]RWS91392.1 site-specific integrase [Klebsiella michiganensis]HBM3057546.1 site-specific integrase [Klebsiella oxytoca]HDE1653479.1 site-specific integrase [Klebsiella pneumoniae]HDE2612507.1 site-specific integrase [Klebsiella pneumoniae]
MNRKKTLTFAQFLLINSQLANISDTWADLWALIFHTGLSAGRLLALRYDDVDGHSILIREQGRLKELCIELSSPAMAMIDRRRKNYPGDVFVFQSHSNRVKYERRPVTLIAFNTALRRAAKSLPEVTVSSSSARRVTE